MTYIIYKSLTNPHFHQCHTPTNPFHHPQTFMHRTGKQKNQNNLIEIHTRKLACIFSAFHPSFKLIKQFHVRIFVHALLSLLFNLIFCRFFFKNWAKKKLEMFCFEAVDWNFKCRFCFEKEIFKWTVHVWRREHNCWYGG